MSKKISALLIALLGSVMLLFGCNDPYKNFSLSVSKTDVILYLTEEGESQEGLTSSEYLMATVSGAGNGISTDVTFSQYGANGVNDLVSIEDVSKDGNKTLFNLKAQKPGRGIIYVNTAEGNKRAEINVTVYVPVKSIDFVTINKAVKFGGEVELGNYLTYVPVGTNQTEVSYFIDDSTNVVATNESGNVTETTYAKIENGKLISKNASSYPIEDGSGLQYVNVYAVSNYNNQIRTQTVKIYVINIVDASQVVLSTNSDLNSQPIVLVPSSGNVYEIILGKNSDVPFIFSRNLKIQIGSDFVTDKQYKISTSLDNKTSNVIGLVSQVGENDRYNYNGVSELYPYKTYQINQQVKDMTNNVEEFDINIDRVGFEGLFTLTFKIKVTVKEFGEEINVYDEENNNVTNSYASIYNVYGGNIAGTPLTLQINPNSSEYKIKAKVINAPQINGVDGFQIFLRNNSPVTQNTELNGGTVLYIKHNYSFSDLQTLVTDPNQTNCPKLVLEYSYTLAPTTLTVGYKTYTVTNEVPLVALAGVTDVGFQITSPIRVNAVTGKAIGYEEPAEGEIYEIVIGTIGSEKVNLNTIISSVTAVSVNGEQNHNFNVFDNDYFKIEYRKDGDSDSSYVNRLVLVPILQPVESSVSLVIKTKNNITKNIRIEIFVPIVYDYVDQGVNQQSVHLEVFEDSSSQGAIYDNSDNTEYFIGVNDAGRITIIPNDEKDEETVYVKSVTYNTQNAITVAVNSTIGFNVYNYVVQTIGEEQNLRAINYNYNVNIIANRSYFSVEYRVINGVRTPFITTGNIKTEVPIEVRLVLSGYDNNGNVVSMTKILMLTIIKPITSIQLNPIESTIYEKTSVGYFKTASSEVELNLTLYPTNAISSDVATRPNISFSLLNAKQVVKSFEGLDLYGNPISVDFLVEDFVRLVTDTNNYKCSVYAEISDSVYYVITNPDDQEQNNKFNSTKFAAVKRRDLSFDAERFFNQIYNESNLIAVVSASLQQYNKPIISSNVSVNVKYAKKVNNIIASVDDKGVYFDSRDYIISNNEIIGEGKEIAFEVEPTNAYNKTLIAYIADTSIARIVSGVDSNNRIVSNTIVVKPYVNAGRTSLIVAAEDSYVYDSKLGIASPGVYSEISVRVANGTKEYPFEISNAEEFLKIGRDINQGNDSYYYVLSDTISLRALETVGETLPPFKKFNGGLNGLFTYSTSGINYSRQNYINDFSLTKQMNVTTGVDYNIGLFEELSETAEIENLIFEGVNFDITILNTNHTNKIDIGVIAGRNYGSILNSRVAGTINVNSETNNLNVGGMVGETFTYETFTITHNALSSDFDEFERAVAGTIAYLPTSTTSASSSKVNSEVVINYVGNVANQNNLTANLGGVAGAAYTYTKHIITEVTFNTSVTKTIVNGYDFKNENDVEVEPDVSVYSRNMQSNYKNLNIVATIFSANASGKLLPANVGGAFGYINSTYLSDITVAPNLMAKTNVGGLVGVADHSIIDSAVVEFANAGQVGANTLSLISEQNVGGLVGYGNNINVYYSYVRSYFNNNGISENYYGNITLVNNSEISNKYAGGLVGYLETSKISEQQAHYGIVLTGEINLDLSLKTLSEGSDEFDEYLFNGTYANGIFNSYFSADINLTYQTLSGNVYAGGLVGGVKTSETAVLQSEQTNIENSYVTGNITTVEPEIVSVTTKSDYNTTYIGTTIEYKIGKLINQDGLVSVASEGNDLIKIETVVTEDVVDASNLKTIITYTVYKYVGAFVGTETNSLIYNREEVSADITKSDDYAEDETTGNQTAGTITTTIVNNHNYNLYKEFGNTVNVKYSYIGSNNFGGVVLNNTTNILVKTFVENQTNVEVKTTSSLDLRVTTIETIVTTDLTKTESFIESDTNKFNIVAVVDEATDYGPYIWLHYKGEISTLNNGYPVLFKYKHINGEILFKVLPTNINTNILPINQKFSNLSYIKQDDNHIVLFNNTYISGKNYKNVNKYKLLLSDEQLSTEFVSMAQIVLDLPNLESVGIIADYASDLIITSSNPNVVEVQNNMVLNTLQEGVSVLRVASKLDVSIYDEVTILVVNGISDHNLYLSKNITTDGNLLISNMAYTQFIDNTSNYFASAINRDVETIINVGNEDYETSVAGGYNGYYQVNSNIGVKLVVNSNNQGVAKVNGETLENGKTYIFSSLSEFNLTGISEGLVTYELTPFIKLNNNQFGETVTSTNGDVTINNCILINDLTKEYLFNIKPKAESLELDKINAKIEPSQSVELNVSVVTSNFTLVGDEVNVNEDVTMVIRDNVTNQIVGNVSLLNVANGNNTSLINVEISSITSEKIYKDGIVQKVKATYKLKLSFNTDAYKNRTGDVTYNLNNISYVLSFTPSTNIELNKQFNINIVPKRVNDIKLKFYANSETTGSGSNAEFNPQEVETNFIVPSRMGLLKIELFPEFNEAEYVELTTTEQYKNYVNFTQKLAVMQGGESGYVINYQSVAGTTEYLPGFIGVKLVNQSMVANSSILYNGNYYVQIGLDRNAPVNANIVFTAKAYKTVNGAKVEVYSKDITLTVQPLPTINLTVNGEHNALINVGGKVELSVEATNFEGDIEFDVTSGKNNSLVTLDYDIEQNKHFIVAKETAIPGDTVTVIARASRYINGIKETRDSTVTLNVVEYIINGIRQQGAVQSSGGNSFEMLNGTNQTLSLVVNASYNQNYENVTTKINTFGLEASGRMTIAGTNEYVNNWYIRTVGTGGVVTDELLNFSTNYENFAFLNKTQNNLNATHYFAINAKRVSTTDVIGAKIQYYYNDAGAPTLYTGNVVGYRIYEQEFFFNLIIKDNSTYDHPNPISNVEQFKALENETSGHFILVNDINLFDYKPFAANFSSLDGNGHFITINNFDTSSFTGGTNIDCGLFTTISSTTVIKNVTLDVSNLLVTQSEIKALNANGTTDADGNVTRNAKINLSNINSFNFGMLAGTNNGSVTNIKVLNTKQTNALDNSSKYLFVYSTIGYISNGTLVDGNVGGLVGVNAGTISNSYIGLNDVYYGNGDNSEELRALTTEGSNRVPTYPFFIVGGKSIGAVVNKNSGIIANSYNLGVGLVNSSTIFSGSKTAGFVVSNGSTGYIFNSMVEGTKTDSYRASSEIYLEATGNIGGFIYENEGRIENAYSNIAIKTNSGGSGGFVYDNKETGKITNAYSTSPNAFNSKAHGQFTGIDARNKFNNAGTLTSCYYLIYNSEVANEDEPAQAIRGKKVEGDSGESKDNPFRYTGSFNGFSFATGSDTNNIWTLGTNENFGPQLISVISYNTFSHRTLTNTREENNTTIYDYIYDDDCVYGSTGITNQVINPLLVNTANEFVTFIANNSKTVPYEDNGETKTLYLFGDKEGGGVYYIRLINDLNFNEIVLNNLVVDNKRISDITFGGVLDGNGMSITGIRLTDLRQDSVHENFGLFYQIGLSKDQKDKTGIDSTRINPSIQNINITINGFAATQSVKVGALAGSMYDTSLINVSLTAGDGVEIVGRNLVGGFAGLIVNSDGIIINNVTTNNITVTASHRSNNVSEVSTLSGYGVALNNKVPITFNSYRNDSKDSLSVLRNYSYAGSIAGVIDANNRNEKDVSLNVNENEVKTHRTEPTDNTISKITVQGGGFIAAEQAGGMFGYVGKNTHIRNSNYIVGYINENSDNTQNPVTRVQQIRGYNYAGGVVGENYGMLEQVSVAHISDWQPQIDKDLTNGITNANIVNDLFGDVASVAIGGIAGFSDQSIILDSFVKVNVVNEKAKVAGGLVGIATRSNYLSHVYATGNVSGSTVIGGLVGLYNKTGLHIIGESENDLKVTNSANVQIASDKFRLTLDYAIAANNWGEDVSEKLTENLQGYYEDGNGGYYKFTLRMPEVGNQAFDYRESGRNIISINYENDLNDKAHYPNLKYNYYIGSLVGKVEELTTNDVSSNKITSGVISAVNAARKISTVNTGYGKYFKFASVISTTLNSGKITYNNIASDNSGIYETDYMNQNFNEMVTYQFPNSSTTDTTNFVCDIVSYTNNIGNQFHLNSIFGLTGKNSNMFGGFAWDAISLENVGPDSGSTVWMIDENLMPAYIVGIYSNFNEISNYGELNEKIRISSNTKNQFYLLNANADSTEADKGYDFASSANKDNETTYQAQSNLFFNTFEGTLIGNPNNGKNPLIIIGQNGKDLSNAFIKINSATIQNVDFKIIIPAGYISKLSARDNGLTSFGLLAKEVKGSVLSNINVEVVFQGGTPLFGYGFNNIGLLFGNVEDSTLSNINVTLTYENATAGQDVQSPSIYTDSIGPFDGLVVSKTDNLNFGILLGNGLRTIISDINITSQNETNNFITLNDTVKNGTVNVGTLAGNLKDCSVQNINQTQLTSNINGEIKVNKTFSATNDKSVYNVGGIIGNLDSSSITNVNYVGNVVVGNSTNNNVSTRLNVGGIVGNVNSSNLNVVMNGYYNTLNGSNPEFYYKNKVISVYNSTTSMQTAVGGVAGFINNSTINGGTNNNITSGNASSITAIVAGGTLDVGGVVGYARNNNNSNGVLKSLNAGSITATNNSSASTYLNVGGIGGDVVGGKYENIFNIGNITITTAQNYNVGGMFGRTSLSSSERESLINLFASYGDIYVNAPIPNINRYVGGVVGTISSNAIRFSKGYTITRVFNAKNANSAFATNDCINGIGYVTSFDVNMFDNIFYIHEFFPYTNSKNLVNGTIGKILLTSYESSVKFGGVSYGNLGEEENVLKSYLMPSNSTGSNNADFDLLNKSIKIPYLTAVIKVEMVINQVNSTLLNTGTKLNPEVVTVAQNQTSINKNINADSYYLLGETGSATVNKTYNLNLTETTFNGLIENISRTGVPNVQGLYGKTNNGILANFYVNVTNQNNLDGALLSENNGNIINVVTNGYLNLTSAPTGNLSMFVLTNNSNIVSSGSSVMLAYDNNITATYFSGFVGYNNNDENKNGKALIKDCYSVSSFIDTNAASEVKLNAPSGGLVYTNTGIIETSYYAGTFSKDKVSNNALVHTSTGEIRNCYFDYDALSSIGNNKSPQYTVSQETPALSSVNYVLTDDMLNSDFVEYGLCTQNIPSSFTTYNAEYNYGYPTINGGIKINTVMDFGSERVFVIWHKGQIDNIDIYNINNVNYLIVCNIDMAEVNIGGKTRNLSDSSANIDIDANKISTQTELKHNLYGNGFTISNLLINEESVDQLGWFKRIDGKTISNLTINKAEVKSTKPNATDNATYGIGIIAGYANNTILDNIKVIGASSVTAENNNNVGGLVGTSKNGRISLNDSSTNVDVDVTASNGMRVGGVVGRLDGTSINSAKFEGRITSKRYVGGIAGYVFGGATIKSCSVVAGSSIIANNLNGSSAFDASIATNIDNGTFKNRVPIVISTITGNISNGAFAGGIVGRTDATSTALIEDCYPENNVTIQANSYSGGVVGGLFNTSRVNYTYAREISGITVNSYDSSVGAIALGGMVGFMTQQSTLENAGSGRAVISGSHIAENQNNKNFAIGGIVGFQNSGTIRHINSKSNTLNGSRMIGGAVGYQNNGVLSNINVENNTLNYQSNKDMDEYDGDGKDLYAGANANYSSVLEATQKNPFDTHLGCVTINSVRNANSYLMGTNTDNRLDEQHGYFAVEYGGLDARSSRIDHSGNSDGNIKLYFGFITGGTYSTAYSAQNNISVSGGTINKIKDRATQYAVYRNRDDFDWDNEWWWHLEKRKIERTLNVSQSNGYFAFNNGTDNYDKFRQYDSTVANQTCTGHYLNVISYIAAGYSIAYKDGVDPISYIQSEEGMAGLFRNQMKSCSVISKKNEGLSILQNLYTQYAYQGMTFDSYRSISRVQSPEIYWCNGHWAGDMVPTDLNNHGNKFNRFGSGQTWSNI